MLTVTFRALTATAALATFVTSCAAAPEASVPTDDATATPVERLLQDLAASGLDDEALFERLYVGALEEGPIVQYTNPGSPPPEVWIPAFERAFPGVQVDVVPLTTVEATDRILAEAGLGRSLSDVVTTTMPGIAVLDDADILANGIEVLAPATIDRRYVASSHVIVASTPYVIAWNTELWTGPEANGWEDLVRPGQPACVVSDRSLSWFGWMVGASGEDGLRSWLDRAEQNGGGIRFGQRNPSLVTALAAGEERCVIVPVRTPSGLKRDGAPIEWSVPPGSPSAHAAFAVLRETAHPHTAALLVAWGLRAEAAALYVARGIFATNGATPDSRPPSDEFVPAIEDVVENERHAAQVIAERGDALDG